MLTYAGVAIVKVNNAVTIHGVFETRGDPEDDRPALREAPCGFKNRLCAFGIKPCGWMVKDDNPSLRPQEGTSQMESLGFIRC
jgi:hypothetical protein